MDKRELGRTGLRVSPLGFGAFKIGRNEKTKYAGSYDLPSDEEVATLLNRVIDLGINYIDTAPAYGSSEQRIGRAIAHRRAEFVLSTKVGEQFRNGTSSYDFSRSAIETSLHASLRSLRTEQIDIVFIHSDGRDLDIIQRSDALPTLMRLQESGDIRSIGFSGKSVEGARAAMPLCDVLMIEYHRNDTSHAEVIAECRQRGQGIVIKKGLASGMLPPAQAIPFVLQTPGVSSMVIGGLNIEHIRSNVTIAETCNDSRM